MILNVPVGGDQRLPHTVQVGVPVRHVWSAIGSELLAEDGRHRYEADDVCSERQKAIPALQGSSRPAKPPISIHLRFASCRWVSNKVSTCSGVFRRAIPHSVATPKSEA